MRKFVCDINECEIEINFTMPLRGDCNNKGCESGQLKLSHLLKHGTVIKVTTKLTLRSHIQKVQITYLKCYTFVMWQ